MSDQLVAAVAEVAKRRELVEEARQILANLWRVRNEAQEAVAEALKTSQEAIRVGALMMRDTVPEPGASENYDRAWESTTR